MKKFLTLITAVFTTLIVSAQNDALQFCYEDGTVIPDGSVVIVNTPDEFMQQFGIYKFNSKVYVKNTLASKVNAALTIDIRSIQGDLSLAMDLQCVMYKEKGSYSIPNVHLATGSINDLQCHWQPAFDEASEKGQAYGKCEADYTISTPDGKCSTITIMFVFGEPNDTYSLTFLVDGNTYSQSKIQEGFPISLPEPPTKEGYTFKGWEGLPEDMLMPTSNLTVTSIFEKIISDEDLEITNIMTLSDAIYTTSLEARNGEQVTLSIMMKNSNEVNGFEFDLLFPNGVIVAEDEDGLLMIDQSFERTTIRKTDHFNVEYNQDGTLHVECYLKSEQTFTGNDGEVCDVTFKIPELMGGGTYPIMLKNIYIKGLDSGQDVSIERIKSILSIWSEFTLADGKPYTNSQVMDINQLTYTRTFNNTDWQPLYVPFSMSYDDWASQGLEVARINGFYEYDDDENGIIDRSALEVLKVKSGELLPNHPYLVRANTTGEKSIVLNDATLYPAEQNSIDCSTVETRYTFIGTYASVSQSELNAKEAYIMGGGKLTPSAGALRPMRWYMLRESRGGQLKSVLKEIKVIVRGEEDVDALDFANEEKEAGQAYNLMGQKVSRDAKGIKIINGRKYVK